MAASDESSPADPDVTETVLAFVNTRADTGGRVEQLGTGADFAGWANDRGLLSSNSIVTDADAATARDLRTALLTIMLTHAGDPELDAGQIAAAEAYLSAAGSRYPLTATVTRHGARLTSPSSGVPGTLGTVLAAVTEAAQSDDWLRVKACCNQPCQNGFVDRTRNRAGRYCNPGCGSQASMRAFRERQRHTATESPAATEAATGH
ncbi:MAG TPA: CGNR zinc finger domain-containing protein [Pseudonocardia sp.]|jgi:predicted RNA-binding Zn ribbon-like protein|nr:CGNR zinc finger domain-containing protein [Pseudonocardia sp.]